MTDALLQDVRQALRGWRRNPGFLAVALATMAAGIGTSTAIFSAVDAVLLRPLPYPDPDRLVAIHSTMPQRGVASGTVSHPDVVDWRAQSGAFAALAAYRSSGAIIGGAEPEYVVSARVTPEFFDVLGVPPVRGAGFPPEAATQPVRAVVLSHRLWQRRFNGDPALVGGSIVLNREPFTVVGVLPPHFQAPTDVERAELYVPLALDGENLRERGNRSLSALGRLRPGATRAQAAAELATIAQRLDAAHADSNDGVGASVRLLHEHMVSDARTPLLVLMAAVACVLLIAGTNVAHLLLPRALARRREVAIRVALGASRARVARGLMVEVVLLWMLGALAGAGVATWAVDALVALAPPETPRLAEIALDARVLAFAVAAALLTGLLFGVMPALTATRVAPGDALRQGGRGGAVGRRRTSGALVVVEMALALVLLVGAGLMVESLRRLVNEPPGFDPDGVLTAEISLPGTRYPTPAERGAFYASLLERLRALPGVTDAALVTPLPLSGDDVTSRVIVEGRPQPPSERPHVLYHAASPTYFDLMRIPLRRGRALAETDVRARPGVVVVSETAAARLFPGEDAIGKHLEIGVSVDDDDVSRFEIVGVVGDVHHRALQRAPEPEVYLPHAQHTWGWVTVVLRSGGSLEPLAAALRREVARIDPEQAVVETRTMNDRLAGSVGVARFVAVLLSLFAGVAVLLAAVGLYGVLATLVAQRTSEIGLRMAVGAEVRHVLGMIVGQAAWLAGLGIVAGALAAAALSRLMQALLFRIAPHDPATFASVAAGLFLVAVLAAARPAWRAAHIDPVVALRDE